MSFYGGKCMKNDYPRLCGGTFLVLVLQALKQRTSARGHINGDSDGLNNPEVLSGLIRVINPDFKRPKKKTFGSNTSDYIRCKIANGTYFPFDDPTTLEAFDRRVKSDYKEALTCMSDFVDTFIDVGTAIGKDVILTKALIELIDADKSIAGQEEFYSCEDGRILTKTELVRIQEACLPAFLLGIWHYIIIKGEKNTVGADTYISWHKAPAEPRGKWTFMGMTGASISRDIKIKICSGQVEDIYSVEQLTEKNTIEQSPVYKETLSLSAATIEDTDPKRITVNNYGTVQNQKFISIETMNGDINL